MKTSSPLHFFAMLTATAMSGLAQENSLPPSIEVQSKLEQWVKTRQIISEEASHWEIEKETLTELNEVRKRETAQLEDYLLAAGERVEQLATQRESFAAEESELKRWRMTLEDRVSKLQSAIKPLLGCIPPPLREKIGESLIRLETENPEEPLQNRTRDLLLVLQAYLEFQSTLTADSEVREIGGERREIDVLYAGMTQAWYVDTKGKHSGYGHPGNDGWIWVEDSSIAGKVHEALDIQSRQAMPAFVELPLVKGPSQTESKRSE